MISFVKGPATQRERERESHKRDTLTLGGVQNVGDDGFTVLTSRRSYSLFIVPRRPSSDQRLLGRMKGYEAFE